MSSIWVDKYRAEHLEDFGLPLEELMERYRLRPLVPPEKGRRQWIRDTTLVTEVGDGKFLYRSHVMGRSIEGDVISLEQVAHLLYCNLVD